MNTKRHMRRALALFTALFLLLAVYLVLAVNANRTRWFTSPYNPRIRTQRSAVMAGDILDRNGVVLATSDQDGARMYSRDRSLRLAVAHAVGDAYGQTFGAETFFAAHLLGFEQSFFQRIAGAFAGGARRGSNVSLTIDAPLCDFIAHQMEGRAGAVVVMNYKTGELLASVSSPAFDPNRMEEYLAQEASLEEGAMVNRVTAGQYTPGSTFKIITLIAALRYLPNVENRTFQCSGALVFDKETGNYLSHVPGASLTEDENHLLLQDIDGEGHGEPTLREAFAVSCNTTFARLALEVGASRLVRTAKSLGVNANFLFSDMVAYGSKLEAGATDYEVAWSGVGQSTDIMTPLHLCMVVGAVANGGRMMEPKLLRQVATAQGSIEKTLNPQAYNAKLSAYEAGVLQEYMVAAVESGTGRRAAIGGYVIGGKTGTAEISSDKTVGTHAWFAGFVLDDDHPLAIVVILEKAGGGGSVAAPVAQNVLKKALDRGY